MDELLAIVGGSWRQLLLYPGGLTMLAVVLVSHRLWARNSQGLTVAPAAGSTVLVQIVCAALCAAILPWPRTYWAYPLDTFTALLLLEAPFWLRLQSIRSAGKDEGGHDAASLLGVYPLLALAVTLLAQDAGSLLVVDIQSHAGLLHWSGVLLWCVTLPPLLLLGPWHSKTSLDLSITVRRAGHIGLITVLVLPERATTAYSSAAVAATVSFGALLALDHLWRDRPQRWERFQPAIALLALLPLLWMAGKSFAARLH